MSVFPMIVRGAAVLAFAFVALRLSRRGPAALRHAVLAFAFAGVLAIPALEGILPTWHTGAIARSTTAIVRVAPAAPVAELATGAPTAAATVAAAAAPSDDPVPWGRVVTGAWLAGALALLARIAIGAARARRLAARGTRIDAHPHATAAWRSLGGAGAPPRLVASDEIDAPIVIGAIAPVVVVPRAAGAWTAERWRVVLLHELAHVRRRDGVAHLVGQLACAVHWVNPLAWIAMRRLRDERELAADDAVLRGGARASVYAEHLLAIASSSTQAPPAAALAMAGPAGPAGPSRFEARVVAMLDAERARGTAGRRRVVAVGAAMALVAALAAGLSPDAAARPAPASGGGGDAIAPRDPALQAIAADELARAAKLHRAAGAVAIVVDAKTGQVLALATEGKLDARAARPPGSTFKPFTFAAALEAGVVAPTSRVDCEHGARRYGDRTLHDSSPNGVLDLGQILAVSSNVCTAKIAELVGPRLASALRRFGFAAPPHLDPRTFDGAATSIGAGIPVSPLDLASAYTALADAGTYHARDGSSARVMSTRTARSVLALLGHPVDDASGTARGARIEGVRVAGKTGTAHTSTPDRYYASFVGVVPADAPRFVVLVGFDGVATHGGKVAAPTFAKIAARALATR